MWVSAGALRGTLAPALLARQRSAWHRAQGLARCLATRLVLPSPPPHSWSWTCRPPAWSRGWPPGCPALTRQLSLAGAGQRLLTGLLDDAAAFVLAQAAYYHLPALLAGRGDGRRQPRVTDLWASSGLLHAVDTLNTCDETSDG